MRTWFHVVAAIVAAGCVAAPALAQQQAEATSPSSHFGSPPKLVELATTEPSEPMKLSEPWVFAITPFLWLPSVSGDLTARGITFDASGDTSDTIDHLDENLNFGLCLHVEASKGRFGILGEVVYVDIGAERDNPALGTTTDGTLKGFIGELGVFYTVVQPATPRDPGALRVDLLGGARITGLEIDIDPQNSSTVSEEKWWVDPYIGVRGDLRLLKWFSVYGRFDVGGFDLGGSKLVWNAVAAGSFHFGKSIDLNLGWRWLDYDFEDGSGANEFAIDALLNGPFVAMTFRF
ncbi:MAG: hypothetical protein WBD40_05760 [Tepidisphaeraceae bacterium]